MDETFRFCFGCNEKFEAPSGGNTCPSCGLSLIPLTSTSTAEIDDVAARETYLGEQAVPDAADDQIVGQRLGPYSIEALAGRGGMARVYRARHLMLHRPCALKVLSQRLVKSDPAYVELFHAEARAVAALVHPNVVTVHNIGYGSSRHFIEMEYIDGYSVRQLVNQQGPLAPLLATKLLLQACKGLREAHQRGIIHRDLKPSNILVHRGETAKLADFGLAKKVVAEHSLRWRNLVGTPYFMAPELFSGQPASTASDVYAAGITYFYMMSATLPFIHSSIHELARMHTEKPTPEISRLRPCVPAETEALLQRCLAKDPQERFADAASLCDALQAVLGHLRDVSTLVREALAERGVEYEGRGERFEVTVPLEDGRSQRVFIEATTDGPVVDRLVKIYSICAPLRDTYFRRALELNAKVPHGSIAIEEIDGQEHFVMGNTYPRATCDPEEVRRSVFDIARWADTVEKVLTGQDQN